jgi:predicted RNase H-like HicB family nuclease
MPEINTLIKDIEKLRKNLKILIEHKEGDLLDEEVIDTSKMLNVLIVEYNKILEKKIKKNKV